MGVFVASTNGTAHSYAIVFLFSLVVQNELQFLSYSSDIRQDLILESTQVKIICYIDPFHRPNIYGSNCIWFLMNAGGFGFVDFTLISY
jgi:hypothetical protein